VSVSSPGQSTSLPTRRENAAAPAAKARFEPKPGLVVADKYKIERVIGEGGMGIVVSATHVGLDQRVALKFLVPEARRNAEAVERFLREARVAAKVNSEHVARVSDVGTVDDGTPFLVMEYLEGDDLNAILRRDGPMPVEEACEITLQACEALAEVHAAGIVHRDLKPSNLFITRRASGAPCVKLLDFGISKLTDPGGGDADPALTATATIMGSPSYMSPEQLRSTKEVDARTDVWSLGAVFYEAVTGHGAFRRETVPQVCAMIASEDPVAPSAVLATVPEALDRAILGCLVKKPEDRSTLIDLARSIVDLAPERARVSLEHIEATQGAQGTALADPSRPRPRPRQMSVTGRSVTARPASVPAERERRTGTRWPVWFAFVALCVLGAGVATGRIDLAKLSGDVNGATSSLPPAPTRTMPTMPAMPTIPTMPTMPTVPPLASVMAPIASAVAPIASAVAPISSAVAPIASALEDLGSIEVDDPRDNVDGPSPSSSSAVSSTPPAVDKPGTPPRARPAKPVAPRPKPGPSRVRHRRH
jgi:serine/threonine protein kinase